MGWVDGFGAQLATVVAFGMPGLEEHLRKVRDDILRKQREEQAQREETEE